MPLLKVSSKFIKGKKGEPDSIVKVNDDGELKPLGYYNYKVGSYEGVPIRTAGSEMKENLMRGLEEEQRNHSVNIIPVFGKRGRRPAEEEEEEEEEEISPVDVAGNGQGPSLHKSKKAKLTH